jgi:hypothetical protein
MLTPFIRPARCCTETLLLALTAANTATAANTYLVGPGKPYANFQALPDLAAGDLVLVDGGGAPGTV